MSATELTSRYRCAGSIPEQRTSHRRSTAPSPRRWTVSESDGADTGPICVGELLRREGHAEGPSPCRSSRVSRMVAVGAGVTVLCAAVVAAATALTGPRMDRALPLATAPGQITGMAALHPDPLSAAVESPSPQRLDLIRLAEPRPETSPAQTEILGVAPDLVPTTVFAFYQTAMVDPGQALKFLDPHLLNAEYHNVEDFEQAWDGVEWVNIDDMRRVSSDTTLVTAALEHSDGSATHTLARIRVSSDLQPRITDATLLSASRS